MVEGRKSRHSCNRQEEITFKFGIYSIDWWCLMNTMVDLDFVYLFQRHVHGFLQQADVMLVKT